MRRNPATASALAIVFLVGPSVGGASQTTPSDGRKDQVIRELIQITGSAALGRQVMEQMLPPLKKAIPDVPESFWDEFMAEVRMDELVDLVVPIYAKHFSLQELEQLLAFYKTPLGKRLIAQMPMVMQESMSVGQAWGQDIAMRAQQKADARRAESPQ